MCIFEHELAYFKFSIVYLLFSLINVQPSALYLEFAFKGILKICLLPRSANQLNHSGISMNYANVWWPNMRKSVSLPLGTNKQ